MTKKKKNKPKKSPFDLTARERKILNRRFGVVDKNEKPCMCCYCRSKART